MKTKHQLGRREALVGLGAAALGTAIVARGVDGLVSDGGTASIDGAHGAAEAGSFHSGAGEASVSPIAMPDADHTVRALFGPLREGSALSTHWEIAAVHGVRAGAIPVVLATLTGERFAVEVFRDAEGGPSPIARAQGLALFLVNHGNGDTPTNELFGLGVVALGRALETQRQNGARIPAQLEPFGARLALSPRSTFDVPLV